MNPKQQGQAGALLPYSHATTGNCASLHRLARPRPRDYLSLYEGKPMQLSSKSLVSGQAIAATNALGVPGPDGPVPGPNKSPHLAWSGVPVSARSFAIICVDGDAPTVADDVNKVGRSVPYDLPRAAFYHWVLVDIPISVSELSEGLDASGMTPKGKAPGRTPHGVRGLNDYTNWFAGDADLAGQYAGYDGPWPPFNDERRHQYTFTVYALDVESLGLSGGFGAAQALKAMEGHIVAQASIGCWYALNPSAR
jgi:Raf kinase inhibitor-like YbhB/YbcL family protein